MNDWIKERELLNYHIYIYLGFNHGVMNTDNMSILGMLDIKLNINHFLLSLIIVKSSHYK